MYKRRKAKGSPFFPEPLTPTPISYHDKVISHEYTFGETNGHFPLLMEVGINEREHHVVRAQSTVSSHSDEEDMLKGNRIQSTTLEDYVSMKMETSGGPWC